MGKKSKKYSCEIQPSERGDSKIDKKLTEKD
jgi:hypothetical protein